MSRRSPRRRSSGELPALARNGLRVVPLGGLGEIGRNMTVFEHAGRLLIVDCGVLFPDEHQPGVDVILPDFTWIRDRLDAIDAIVLTHGHEDHIGGVPYLLRERPDIPVVGSRLTLALLESKLTEHRITPRHRRGRRRASAAVRPVRLRVRRGQPLHPRRARRRHPHRGGPRAAHRRLQDGPVPARRPGHRPARVRPAGRGGGRPLPRRLHQRRGPRLHRLRGASWRPRSTPSSAPPRGRVIVSSFASHVHRIQQILDAAQRHGRKVAFVGRSMVRNMGIARDLGYLTFPDGLVVKDLKALERLRPDQMAIIATGSQGEPMAALARMANRDHPVSITAGRHGPDGQLADPRQRERHLPGHQRAHPVGCHVVHKGNAKVHVSGPRQRRRARLLLQHHPALERPAGARRVAAPARQRRHRDPHRRRRRPGAHRPGRLVIDLVDGRATHHRHRAGGAGLRRRDDRRRRHRGDACTCGAPSPRRAS